MYSANLTIDRLSSLRMHLSKVCFYWPIVLWKVKKAFSCIVCASLLTPTRYLKYITQISQTQVWSDIQIGYRRVEVCSLRGSTKDLLTVSSNALWLILANGKHSLTKVSTLRPIFLAFESYHVMRRPGLLLGQSSLIWIFNAQPHQLKGTLEASLKSLEKLIIEL